MTALIIRTHTSMRKVYSIAHVFATSQIMKKLILILIAAACLYAQPNGVPPGAVPIMPSKDTPFPQVQAQTIAGVERVVADMNFVATGIAEQGCRNWTQANGRNRDMGLKLVDKPVAPAAQVVKQHDDPSGIIWVWIAEGDPVSTCADLPALPVPGGLVIDIGVSLGGAWYQATPKDNAPCGIRATKPDGTYLRVCSPFGAWYQKQ